MKTSKKCVATMDFLDEKPWTSTKALPSDVQEHILECKSCLGYMKVTAGIKESAEAKEKVQLLKQFYYHLHEKQDLKRERKRARWTLTWTGALAALILFAGITWNMTINKNMALNQAKYTAASSSSSDLYQEAYDSDASDLKYVVQISLSM